MTSQRLLVKDNDLPCYAVLVTTLYVVKLDQAKQPRPRTIQKCGRKRKIVDIHFASSLMWMMDKRQEEDTCLVGAIAKGCGHPTSRRRRGCLKHQKKRFLKIFKEIRKKNCRRCARFNDSLQGEICFTNDEKTGRKIIPRLAGDALLWLNSAWDALRRFIRRGRLLHQASHRW